MCQRGKNHSQKEGQCCLFTAFVLLNTKLFQGDLKVTDVERYFHLLEVYKLFLNCVLLFVQRHVKSIRQSVACFMGPFANTLVPPKAVKTSIQKLIKHALSCSASRSTSVERVCEPCASRFAGSCYQERDSQLQWILFM